MTQKIGQLAYTLARQLLVKDKGGIASLPSPKEILTKVQDIFDMLKAGGYNPVSAEKSIKSTKDLKQVLTDVEMKLTIDKNLRSSQSEGIEEVMKKMDRGIPLNPSDQAKMEGIETVADDKVLDAFKGFKPKVIQGGKGAETEAEIIARMNKQNKDSVARLKEKKEKDLGSKLEDYDGDPDAMAIGGRAGFGKGDIVTKGLPFLMKEINKRFGKKAITTADKIDRPESALNREMFGAFNERVNRKTLEVPSMPSGFQLSREKLLKNFPELDESYADEIMAMDKELQGRVLTMLKDRRKNPEAYDKLLMEKGDTLDFQGEFDRSVKRSKNAGGGLAYMLGEPRDGLKEGGPPNPGRRNFMKLMAGLASIPVLGKFFKPAAKVAKTVTPLTNTTTTMPAWFPKFVDKVIDKGVGTKIDADIMKYEVKELPGIQVTKHDDGRVFVEGKNDYYKSYEIEYEPPGYVVVDEKTGKAVKTKGDFTAQEEVPVNVDPDGNADFDGEVLESVDNILSSDARTMEEFATGKKIKEMKRGEFEVGRAESLADAARKGEDFATGGLAKLLGE